MTVANEAIREVAHRLPLKVVSAEWQDPALLLHGDGWRMTVMTPWRVPLQGRLLLGSDNADSDEVAKLLAGNIVATCKSQSSDSFLDPSLGFVSGHVLEIFSVSPLEPWLLYLGEEVFVASPSE